MLQAKPEQQTSVWAPKLLLADHRIEHPQHVTEASRQGDLLKFSFCQQALIKSFEHKVATHRRERGHIQHGTDIRPATADVRWSLA